MTESAKYVIVGGVAGGATAAARIRRLSEDAQIILFEKETYESRLSRSFNNSLYFSFNVALRKDF